MLTRTSRQTRILLPLLCLVLLPGCVSRSQVEQRVARSLELAPSIVAPVVGNPNEFSFAFVGDLHVEAGRTGRLTRVLASAQADGDEFLLLLGDLTDQAEAQDMEAIRQAVDSAGWTGRVFYVAGNHDIYYAGWDHYVNWLGSSTYRFDVGNSRFIALDSADATLGDSQTRWLRTQLEDPPQHTFIFSHYLPLVPGIRTYLKLSNHFESLDLMSLASRAGVRAWLGAHYHSYLNGEAGGVSYVVAGGGGGRRMAPVAHYFYVQARVDGASVDYTLKPLY